MKIQNINLIQKNEKSRSPPRKSRGNIRGPAIRRGVHVSRTAPSRSRLPQIAEVFYLETLEVSDSRLIFL